MATVLSVAGVTISANGGNTGDLLFQINAATSGFGPGQIVTVGGTDSVIPAAPTVGGPFELVIEPDYTGSLAIPSGYAFVINAATADTNPISGGDATTAIVATGDINYAGGAGTVVGIGGSGSITDEANGASIAINGAYSVVANGNGDVIGIDGSAGDRLTVNGSGDVINIGGGGPSSAAAGAAGAFETVSITSASTSDVVNIGPGSSSSHIFVAAAALINQAGGSTTIVTQAGGTVTLASAGGSDFVYDTQGGSLIQAAPTDVFVNVGATASTVEAAAGGADTIFALSSVDYTDKLGTANTLTFVGGAGAVTVSAAAVESVYGGTGGGSYSIGATSFQFVSGGGADTLTGGPGATSVFAYGGSNENLTVSQMVSSPGNTFFTLGNNETINAMNAAGHNTWDIVDPFSGDTSLVGSNVGNDQFVVFMDVAPGAGTTAPTHTVDISNWLSSDTMFINNVGAANGALNEADVNAVNQFVAGGSGSTLTLSDGTVINFTGAKPTTIGHT